MVNIARLFGLKKHLGVPLGENLASDLIPPLYFNANLGVEHDASSLQALPETPAPADVVILDSITGGIELTGGDGALGFPELGRGKADPSEGSAPVQKALLELLVQFAPDADVAQVKSAAASLGGSVVETIYTSVMAEAGQGVVVRITFGQGLTMEQAVEIAGKLPGVTVAEPNWGIGVQAVSNDPYFTGGNLWGMYSEQSPFKSIYGSQAYDAWAAGHTGSSIDGAPSRTVIGVIDTGIDYTHPDLFLNIWINQLEIPLSLRSILDFDGDNQVTFRDLNKQDSSGAFLSVSGGYIMDANNNGRIDAFDLLAKSVLADGKDTDGNGRVDDLVGWDFVNNDNNPFDDNGHGTHVAGTIGACGGNGTGVVGVAWDVQIMALKTLSASGSGATSGAIQAVDYYTAASKAAGLAGLGQNYVATNNSWGGGGYSTLLHQSITEAAKQGILFLAAAGNGGSDGVGDNNDLAAYYPACYNTTAGAGYDAVIAVASLTSSGALSSFSNYGKTSVELAAPGSSIWSTLPGGTNPAIANSGKYGNYSGTSMAAPHVAGAIALYAALNPTATAAEIRDALLASTASTASLDGKTLSGGRLDIGTLASLGLKSGILEGTAGDDLLVGTDKDDTLNGYGGNDTLIGAHGNDKLYGGDGNDTLVLDAGDDLLDGGLGFNWVQVDGTAAAWIDLAVTAAQDTGYGWDTLLSIENVSGGSGADKLYGIEAANTLRGGLGNDIVSGRGGNDTLEGGAGDDVLDGGADSDQVWGGDGNDIFIFDAGDDRLDGEAGIDWIHVTGSTAAIIYLAKATVQSTGYGDDIIRGIENVSGGFGADKLYGNSGANVLHGNAGDDLLHGRAGADTLWGGLGTDRLYGGASDGACDVFVFTSTAESAVGTKRDVIYTFVSGIDNIDLRGIDANTNTTASGDQAFLFSGTTAQANSVWYAKSSSDLIVRGDVNGDKTADFEIRLVGVSALAAGDFWL